MHYEYYALGFNLMIGSWYVKWFWNHNNSSSTYKKHHLNIQFFATIWSGKHEAYREYEFRCVVGTYVVHHPPFYMYFREIVMQGFKNVSLFVRQHQREKIDFDKTIKTFASCFNIKMCITMTLPRKISPFIYTSCTTSWHSMRPGRGVWL